VIIPNALKINIFNCHTERSGRRCGRSANAQCKRLVDKLVTPFDCAQGDKVDVIKNCFLQRKLSPIGQPNVQRHVPSSYIEKSPDRGLVQSQQGLLQ
jgi:hypothetical protein